MREATRRLRRLFEIYRIDCSAPNSHPTATVCRDALSEIKTAAKRITELLTRVGAAGQTRLWAGKLLEALDKADCPTRCILDRELRRKGHDWRSTKDALKKLWLKAASYRSKVRAIREGNASRCETKEQRREQLELKKRTQASRQFARELQAMPRSQRTEICNEKSIWLQGLRTREGRRKSASSRATFSFKDYDIPGLAVLANLNVRDVGPNSGLWPDPALANLVGGLAPVWLRVTGRRLAISDNETKKGMQTYCPFADWLVETVEAVNREQVTRGATRSGGESRSGRR
jgi:hypothetical protein